MRRLSFILLASLFVVPAAVAATRAAGDGVFELRAVNASSALIAGSRGSLWGQMDSGRLVVTDPVAGDGQIYVSGADHTHPVNENVTVYWGKDIHFRVLGGKYRLSFKGTGIDLTAVGVGTALLIGDIRFDDTGDYALDGGKWTPVPFIQRSVQFGVPPTTTTP